ncbi:MAG TPA: mandelate racemase/muconate lactonizing enzyme family protein [Alphaproteobacteria bacterium]|jgi:L-alanine-DL-glutamate epimerase-like enolase superfamily enzyme
MERPTQITKVDLIFSSMPKEDPTWRFALGANPLTEGWIVCLSTADGTTGYGYANASAHLGSTVGSLKAVIDRFAPLLVGQDAFDVELVLQTLNQNLTLHNQAKGAIDSAMYDLQAKLLGLPLYKMFGGKLRTKVPVLRILAIKKPHEMAAAAQALVDKGYSYFKIKVHGDVPEDVACVKAIRKQVGDDMHLTIDANQSYNAKAAITAINRMAEFNIDLVEQPVKIDDLGGLKLVTESVPVTIEADESAGSLQEVMNLVSNRMIDAVSLKIPNLGGIRQTIAAARICEAGGVQYRFGATVGSRLLAATAMHLACALPGVNYACEFGEFDRLLNDPFEGIEIEDGHLTLPEGVGCGVTPVPASKQKATTSGGPR